MKLIDLAAAHLETIRTRITELSQQGQQIDLEIQRLNEILEEGTRLVELNVTPSDNSTVIN
jgi:hypothetical protein